VEKNKNEDKTIDIRGKSDKDIFDTYVDISNDTLLLHELLKKYENKENALEEYQKIKSKKNISKFG